jgi:hypothetical protein
MVPVVRCTVASLLLGSFNATLTGAVRRAYARDFFAADLVTRLPAGRGLAAVAPRPWETPFAAGLWRAAAKRRAPRAAPPTALPTRSSTPSPAERLRGLPPLNPFLRAAAAFAGDRTDPPEAPATAKSCERPNTSRARPATLRSASNDGHRSPTPAGPTSIAATSRSAAPRSSAMPATGTEKVLPFVSVTCRLRVRRS